MKALKGAGLLKLGDRDGAPVASKPVKATKVMVVGVDFDLFQKNKSHTEEFYLLAKVRDECFKCLTVFSGREKTSVEFRFRYATCRSLFPASVWSIPMGVKVLGGRVVVEKVERRGVRDCSFGIESGSCSCRAYGVLHSPSARQI